MTFTARPRISRVISMPTGLVCWVVIFALERGDRFEPRLHRRVGGEPTGDPEAAGRVALVRRSGYLDIDTNTPIAPAEVVLFVPASAGSPERPGPSAQRSDPGECAPREDLSLIHI